MGGASRNAKRRQQEEARARLAAAGLVAPPRAVNRTALIAVAAVVAVVVLVGIGVLLARLSPADAPPPTYPVAVDGAVVTAGPASAPVQLDVYSDYICPACERFDQRYGAELTAALNAGRITVRYHGIGLLDANSDPPGYSTRAANASICAAQAGVFPAYHERLYDEQPTGGPGLSVEELVALGAEVGAPASFGECVIAGTHADAVAAQTQAMLDNPAVRNPDGRVGTPSVLLDGVKVDLNDEDWLADALAS